MKIQIENLKAFMSNRYEFSIYQKADAIVEFNKLVAYTEELEQLNLGIVIKGEADSVCVNCGDVKSNHSKASSLCNGQFTHFKQIEA